MLTFNSAHRTDTLLFLLFQIKKVTSAANGVTHDLISACHMIWGCKNEQGLFLYHCSEQLDPSSAIQEQGECTLGIEQG